MNYSIETYAGRGVRRIPTDPTLRFHSRSQDSIWTDKHVSSGMLRAHLDCESDGASGNVLALFVCAGLRTETIQRGLREKYSFTSDDVLLTKSIQA